MTDFNNSPFVTISSRQPTDSHGFSSGDSTYGSSLGSSKPPSATHDISRVNYHLKRLPDFAKALEDSVARAFPNHGSSQRYKKVYVLLLYWDSDDLFVLPELEDLERCFQNDYNFETERFTIPSGNAHLDLMLKIGAMIKQHESTDTLLIVYYGGHARIDDARQSTWCATRNLDSPWLQWSAIQTLLERSLSDALILLDCCAGAASAAFPTGNSVTETISASSWDAIAPEPGRYSFTSTLLEVLQDWKGKMYSVAMLHAEILARLKHPRPERRNGNHFEARTTPVHFMMTANHKAPSIELCRVSDDILPPSPRSEPISRSASFVGGPVGVEEIIGSEPNEGVPHVMISLALEDNQNLNINDWERWLATIPALAKYVQVQGIFKSHSTLLLVSLPVMVWDMLPDNHACNFIAFIRSNNLVTHNKWDISIPPPPPNNLTVGSDNSESTTVATDRLDPSGNMNSSKTDLISIALDKDKFEAKLPDIRAEFTPAMQFLPEDNMPDWLTSTPQLSLGESCLPFANFPEEPSAASIAQKSTQAPTFHSTSDMSDQLLTRPTLPAHAENRLEEYFISNPNPTVAVKEFLASNLNLETADIDGWFRHRREQQAVFNRLQSLSMGGQSHNPPKEGSRMLLPGHLNKLLEIFPTGQIVVIDLRPNSNYQRSHIHGAINFTAPASFVSRASMEMIEKALIDDASRSSFDKWYTSKCVVFYDKVVEYPWEAPVAEALFRKFKSKHWPGQCFVLKGHYREFSQSFDKYIVGTTTTKKATEYLASLQDVSWGKHKDDNQRYDDWLQLLDGEDRTPTTELPAAVKATRLQAIDQQQQALDIKFSQEFPHLHRLAQTRQPDDNWAIKAPMVAHLERGVAKIKMQQKTRLGHVPTITTPIDEVGAKDYAPKTAEDNQGYYYRNQQQLNVWQGATAALHKSSSASALRGIPSPTPASATMSTAIASDISSAPLDKTGRGGPKNLFARIIRSGRPDTPSR